MSSNIHALIASSPSESCTLFANYCAEMRAIMQIAKKNLPKVFHKKQINIWPRANNICIWMQKTILWDQRPETRDQRPGPHFCVACRRVMPSLDCVEVPHCWIEVKFVFGRIQIREGCVHGVSIFSPSWRRDWDLPGVCQNKWGCQGLHDGPAIPLIVTHTEHTGLLIRLAVTSRTCRGGNFFLRRS